MSAFVIGDTTSTTLHRSKLAFESSVANSLNKKTYLRKSEAQTVLLKLELLQFIETVFVHRSIVGYSSRILLKMCCTDYNIWVEMFWNSVVNIT